MKRTIFELAFSQSKRTHNLSAMRMLCRFSSLEKETIR